MTETKGKVVLIEDPNRVEFLRWRLSRTYNLAEFDSIDTYLSHLGERKPETVVYLINPATNGRRNMGDLSIFEKIKAEGGKIVYLESGMTLTDLFRIEEGRHYDILHPMPVSVDDLVREIDSLYKGLA